MSYALSGTDDTRARIERLEQSIRTLQGLTLVGLALLAGLAAALAWFANSVAGARSASTIEARRFVLKDESGTVRGTFEVDGSNNARLVLGDQAAPTPRGNLVALGAGPGIGARMRLDANGPPQAGGAQAESGILLTQGGNLSASLTMREDGSSYVSLKEPRGGVVVLPPSR
jgi:hypothetical protein